MILSGKKVKVFIKPKNIRVAFCTCFFILFLFSIDCRNSKKPQVDNPLVPTPALPKTFEKNIPDSSGSAPEFFTDVQLPGLLEMKLTARKPKPVKSSRTRPLVLFVGFDGMTWKILKPLIKNGLLKNFKTLCKMGSYGILQTDEGLSPISWTSITTGMAKEQHGIYGENVWNKIYAKNVLHVWDILADRGWKLGILGYPYLYEKYLPKNASFMEDNRFIPKDILKDFKMDDFSDLESKLLPSADKVYVMLKEKYDICFSLFQFTDLAQHAAYQHFFVNHNFGIKNIKTTDPIQRVIINGASDVIDSYKIADRIMERLFELEPDYIFIMSDHGFTNSSINFSVYLNPKMIDELSHIFPNNDISLFWAESGYENKSILLAGDDKKSAYIRNHPIFCKIPWAYSNNGEILSYAILSMVRWIIDYSDQKPPEEFFKLVEDVREKKCNGLPCFDVKTKNNAFFIDLSPQVIEKLMTPVLEWDNLTVEQRNGDHGPADPGIFIMTGQGIRPGFELQGAVLHDITPTLLYLLGYPVANDMAGKVLVDGIEPKYLKSHPVQKIESYGRPKTNLMIRHEPSPTEKQRLEALGYIPR